MFSLGTSRFDELGLRRALADRMIPFLVAAMAFLAALALAGWMGAAVLAGRWEGDDGSALTVQVPRAGEPAKFGTGTRLAAVQALLNSAPGVESAKTLSGEQLDVLLRPWLGGEMKDLASSIPAVIAVHLTNSTESSDGLATMLSQRAPGTIVEDHAVWAARLGALARSLQLCSAFVLLIVTMVTAAVIAVVTRSGLSARREAILIFYQLGATDGYIVQRFAARAAVLASIGGVIGGTIALPVVFVMATMAAPLAGGHVPVPTATDALSFLPLSLWLLPPVLLIAAGLVGYVSTQFTMRQWLRQLP
jgi:cell division transport system permease protein